MPAPPGPCWPPSQLKVPGNLTGAQEDVPLCLPNGRLCLSLVSQCRDLRGRTQSLLNACFSYSHPPCPWSQPHSNLVASRSLALRFQSSFSFSYSGVLRPGMGQAPMWTMAPYLVHEDCSPLNFSSFGPGSGGGKSPPCAESASADRREKTFCDFE